MSARSTAAARHGERARAGRAPPADPVGGIGGSMEAEGASDAASLGRLCSGAARKTGQGAADTERALLGLPRWMPEAPRLAA
jgi:hypothetical protein